MGMGLFFLAAMVLGAGYDMIRANALKVLVVAIFTLVIIFVFQWRGLIDWRIGLVLALGQAAISRGAKKDIPGGACVNGRTGTKGI